MNQAESTRAAAPSDETFLEEVEDVGDAGGGVRIRDRFGLVLALLLILYVLAAFEPGTYVTLVITLLWIALLLTILWSSGLPARIRRIGLGAIALLLITSIPLGLLNTDVSAGWRFVMLGIAQLAAMLAVLSRVFRHQVVTFQTVMGGVAAYALMAFIMGSVYSAGDLFSQGAFLNGVVNDGDYTYFSFITLTTVGYGDITPATVVAKRLVVVEAFVGQVFIITLVARLVSLWGKPLRG